MSRALLQDYDGGERKLKVAWDAGNGAAGADHASALAAKLPGEHFVLNERGRRQLPEPPSRPDGAGEPRGADRRGDAKDGCDLGIAFDGDGDRIGVVDGEGRILWGDQLLVILSRATC